MERYFDQFRKNIVGVEETFHGPYGEKKIVYFDWTASGRLFHPIEDRIIHTFGPYTANTHTEANITGITMTKAYKQALNLIKRHVNAKQTDVLVTEGSGATGVINKFQRIIGLKIAEAYRPFIQIKKEDKPVVFLTHMEHHSNHISWLETIADVVVVTPNHNGEISLKNLESSLKHFQNRKVKIGAFTACSNVTGVVTPYHQMAKLMHQYGGICLIDFSASAPYIKINMHPKDKEEKLDAIVFSPHKFLGGPGSSGVLIFDSSLYKNNIPDNPGGGTVTWTNPWGGRKYIDDIELKEDGGTPGFLQAIRTALAIQLKEKMGIDYILKREKHLTSLLMKGLAHLKNVVVLDSHIKNRLGIVSFCIKNVHYNLAVKLLNDLYGIQVRGGCSCAGPYGHFLLNIDQAHSKYMTDEIDKGNLSSKPGWVRVSIHPTAREEEIHYLLYSLTDMIQNIDRLKVDYQYNGKTNEFVHRKSKDICLDKWFEL
ncbi:aminotransferase class V-fold PLP-dependent enzyme [Pseudobacillus wudalianchiensis]|uniref:Selenocysteine lyase n=1 Tax=Pseudobacillus wudalianchiensis TaxID=1743143 RepID=A0A1B9AIP6_9BACI|nr:aminotransferase class V-fold PLP-dependent enzyme [Bacillus wudalianchiensis]OCA83710.1 selenocysteine lyase [Bacillus wudalianchiensis]